MTDKKTPKPKAKKTPKKARKKVPQRAPKSGKTAAHKPTDANRRLVLGAVGRGATQSFLCAKLGIDLKTLYKYYRYELDHGLSEAVDDMAGTLFRQAKAGSTSAAIFYLKCQARWSDKTEIVHSGKVTTEATVNLEAMSEKQLEAYLAFQATLQENDENSEE